MLQCRRPGFNPWARKIPWKREWQPIPRYSCLENSRDRGAWQTTVHGVAKSWTRLTLPLPLICCQVTWVMSDFVQPRKTAAHQAPQSLGFSRQGYWSGLPFPSLIYACMLSCFSHVQLYTPLWTAAHQAPLSTGFSRQEYWSGLPFPSPIYLSICVCVCVCVVCVCVCVCVCV